MNQEVVVKVNGWCSLSSVWLNQEVMLMKLTDDVIRTQMVSVWMKQEVALVMQSEPKTYISL